MLKVISTQLHKVTVIEQVCCNSKIDKIYAYADEQHKIDIMVLQACKLFSFILQLTMPRWTFSL